MTERLVSDRASDGAVDVCNVQSARTPDDTQNKYASFTPTDLLRALCTGSAPRDARATWLTS